MKLIPPSTNSTSFNCAHCGVLTTQFWSDVFGVRKGKNELPFIPDQSGLADILSDETLKAADKKRMVSYVAKLVNGEPFANTESESKFGFQLENIFVSECYDCKKLTIWVNQRPIYPSLKNGPSPNPDLPDGTFQDYEEARSILELSPRGAAALLRLCIQKICIHLGEKGRKIDDDIASLAAKGLHPIVKKSLDIVRVVGNDAVHPGAMDLRDDRETALQLFSLVNAICEQMISLPKSVEDLYQKIPQAKRDAIDERDAKAAAKVSGANK